MKFVKRDGRACVCLFCPRLSFKLELKLAKAMLKLDLFLFFFFSFFLFFHGHHSSRLGRPLRRLRGQSTRQKMAGQ